MPPWLVQLGVSYVFKKLRERMKREAMERMKGKLTYASVLAFALPLVGQMMGLELAESEMAALLQAAGVLGALWGRYRASRSS